MYESQQWRDGDKRTPLSSARLLHLEAGISDASARVSHLPIRPEGAVDVRELVVSNRAGLKSNHDYFDPSAGEVSAVLAAVDAMARGEKPPVVPAGMAYAEGWEENARRGVRVLYSVPGSGLYWGVFVVPMGVPVSGLVEAPHPVFDTGSDDVAVRVWEQAPVGTVLAVAGSHRTNPDGTNPRDAAHNPKTMFHQVVTRLAQPGLPELQLHGFGTADDMAGVDAVVSSGSSPLSAGVVRLDAYMNAAGLHTQRQWDGTATKLTGMVNIQGDAAELRGSPFGHIETGPNVRSNPDAFIAAVTASGFLAGDNGTLLTNEFPKPVGSVNSRGESATAARADHTHRLVQNTPKNGEVVARIDSGWRSVAPSELGLSGGTADGYQKPADGIPVADLAKRAQDVVSAVEAATYSANSETLMRRTKTGAVSVGDPTASVHATNKKYVDGVVAALEARVAALEAKLNGS